ncbi:MAG: prepilin-type N-terminal cleavage/methylation domain-containing protein [Acidobacteria bacterium]|nr:prepilin-type N-terminal cleavage/methylation domain-containing protein [Acidobacteriota bacterium]
MKKSSAEFYGQKGVTILELLLSMTVFLIGIAAIYGVTRLATIQKNTVNSRTDQLRSARIALEYIRRDGLNAGFGFHRTGGNIPDNAGNTLFNMPADTDTQRDFMTSVMAANNVNSNLLNFGGYTDAVIFISRDPSFNSGALVNYTGAAASGNAVNVTTAANACANCSVFDVYLFESSSGTTQMMGMLTTKNSSSSVQFSPGDPLGLNQSATGSGDAQSLLVTTAGGGTIKRVNIVSYSVTSAGVLVRKKYGNQTGLLASQQIETRELVYGVSDFQIKYYMEDGTTVDDPSLANNGRTNQIKMNSVVQIQVSITLASDANDSQPKVTTPVVIKEFISTKNLRYEAS